MADFTKISKIFNEHQGTPTAKEVLVGLFKDIIHLNPNHPFWNQQQTSANDTINRIATALENTNAEYQIELKIADSISQCHELLPTLPTLKNSLQAFLECYPYLIPKVKTEVIAILNPVPYGVERTVEQQLEEEQQQVEEVASPQQNQTIDLAAFFSETLKRNMNEVSFSEGVQYFDSLLQEIFSDCENSIHPDRDGKISNSLIRFLQIKLSMNNEIFTRETAALKRLLQLLIWTCPKYFITLFSDYSHFSRRLMPYLVLAVHGEERSSRELPEVLKILQREHDVKQAIMTVADGILDTNIANLISQHQRS